MTKYEPETALRLIQAAATLAAGVAATDREGGRFAMEERLKQALVIVEEQFETMTRFTAADALRPMQR